MPGLDDSGDEDFPTVGMADYENDEPPAQRRRLLADVEHDPDARGSGDRQVATPEQLCPYVDGGIFTSMTTGVPDVDNMKFGLPIGSAGRLLVHKRPDSVKIEKDPERQRLKFEDLAEKLIVSHYDQRQARRTQNMVFLWKNGATMEEAINHVKKSIVGISACYTVGLIDDDAVLCYVFKSDMKTMNANWVINGKLPEFYRFVYNKGVPKTEETLANIEQAFKVYETNMRIVWPTVGRNSYTFHRILEVTKMLTMQELHILKGQAAAVHWKDRSDWQAALLRCFMDVKMVRELQSQQPENVFNAYEPPYPIPSMTQLQNLYTTFGSRMKEVVLTREELPILCSLTHQTTRFAKTAKHSPKTWLTTA